MKITRDQLLELLTASGASPMAAIMCGDEQLETVSGDWVRENWLAWLDARPDELVIWEVVYGVRMRVRPRWIAEVSDCDNLALGVVAHAQVGNALAAVHTGAARGGLAFGVLFYQAGPARPGNYGVAGGHAINWYVEHSGALSFWEPGVGHNVELTPEEKASVWFALAV